MLSYSVTELMEFLDKSVSAYHGVDMVKKILRDKGYSELIEKDKWELKENGKYFVTKNQSAMIAFEMGNGSIEEGFRIVSAHTDSPCFKIKPANEIISEDYYVKLNTEVYGSIIASTWFDRPLSIAGRVAIKGDNILEPIERLINIDRPILIIPNLAIHFNREINDGYKYNNQKDLLPVLGFVNAGMEKDEYLLKLIGEELKVDIDKILDFELFIYECQKSSIIGINNEFISAAKLDDLWMVFAGLVGLTSSGKGNGIKMLMLTDNEEVGSSSSQGARSSFISHVLERICSFNSQKEVFYQALANSFMISADCAHAIHPNHMEIHDPSSRPLLGKGPVIKYAASQAYATNGKTAAIFADLCRSRDIPFQKFVNRSDLKGGSTIGTIISALLGIDAVDMGAPVLAMHSVRELGAVKDHEYCCQLFKEFYEL